MARVPHPSRFLRRMGDEGCMEANKIAACLKVSVRTSAGEVVECENFPLERSERILRARIMDALRKSVSS